MGMWAGEHSSAHQHGCHNTIVWKGCNFRTVVLISCLHWYIDLKLAETFQNRVNCTVNFVKMSSIQIFDDVIENQEYCYLKAVQKLIERTRRMDMTEMHLFVVSNSVLL